MQGGRLRFRSDSKLSECLPTEEGGLWPAVREARESRTGAVCLWKRDGPTGVGHWPAAPPGSLVSGLCSPPSKVNTASQLSPWPAPPAGLTSRPLLGQKGEQVRPHWGLRGKERGAKGMDTKDEGDSGGEMGEQGDGEASEAREDAERSKPQDRGTCKRLRRSRDA